MTELGVNDQVDILMNISSDGSSKVSAFILFVINFIFLIERIRNARSENHPDHEPFTTKWINNSAKREHMSAIIMYKLDLVSQIERKKTDTKTTVKQNSQ